MFRATRATLRKNIDIKDIYDINCHRRCPQKNLKFYYQKLWYNKSYLNVRVNICATAWNKQIIPQIKAQACTLQLKLLENPN
jgi:hypothetical protein